ncbi:hypothetical protein D5086_017281 [Populus alba]|uniref:Uncharacterized protein n=1 Tax=Populus alba TaxID=43335 RepID=A0ACC4BWM5_POPAL
MIDDHYNEIMIMNERSSYAILESNVKEKQNVEKSLEHKVDMKNDTNVDEIHELSFVDKWFLTQHKEVVDAEQYLMARSLSHLTKDGFSEVKKHGFSDKQIAFATKSTEKEVRSKRNSFGGTPSYKRVDACAAEFETNTPYMYSSYDSECESAPTKRKKVLILDGGPNHYDTSDCLYFEPSTEEEILNVIELERPDGIIVQFGGQTPLKLALPIQQGRFNAILKELNIEQPKGGIAKSEADALAIAADIGFPVVVCQSYVSDKYLSDAVEIDVDTLADSHNNVVIGGVMEHIEQAGVHSGDSACILPSQTISSSCLNTIRSWTKKLAKSLNVCGLMNCQYTITVDVEVFLLEANPCASRMVPFVSKAIGHPLAQYAARVMSGKSLNEILFTKEMRSTTEVMGIDFLVAIAFAKAQIAAGLKLPLSGTVFLSLNDLTKSHRERLAKAFLGLRFRIVSTSGTAHFLELKGISVDRVLKMHEGQPHAGDLANGHIQLMVITSSGDSLDQIDGQQLRMALAYRVPIITTVSGALATSTAIEKLKSCTIEQMLIYREMPKCMCMPSLDPCVHLAVIFIRCMMMVMEKDRRFEGQGEGWTQRLLWRLSELKDDTRVVTNHRTSETCKGIFQLELHLLPTPDMKIQIKSQQLLLDGHNFLYASFITNM